MMSEQRKTLEFITSRTSSSHQAAQKFVRLQSPAPLTPESSGPVLQATKVDGDDFFLASRIEFHTSPASGSADFCGCIVSFCSRT